MIAFQKILGAIMVEFDQIRERIRKIKAAFFPRMVTNGMLDRHIPCGCDKLICWVHMGFLSLYKFNDCKMIPLKKEEIKFLSDINLAGREEIHSHALYVEC